MTSDENSKARKERVLHTRIPESLDEEIRDRAERLGVSVSNLVRNVLQNALGLVGDIVADTTQLARSARSETDGETERSSEQRASASPTILGWQEVVLNLNAICEACNAILPRGSRAAIAVVDGPGRRIFRCSTCLEELTRAASNPQPE